MGDGEVQQGDITGQMDCEYLFDDIPIDINLFADDLPLFTESFIDDSVQENSNPSPHSVSSWVDEIEQLLMNDDQQVEEEVEENQEFFHQDFFTDILLDMPADPSEEVRASNDEFSNPESNVSKDSHEKENTDVSDVKKGQDFDPISKKRKRQLRNRDAAVRSRERKKTYIRDLELKSRYFEGECRRLERLLQCCYAENQALHLRLEKDKEFGASRAKQESAVLLLESLLLGSLLWFLGIMCLFSLPGLLRSTPATAVLENVGNNVMENLPLGGTGNERLGFGVLGRMFLKSKRCKSTRTKMKTDSAVLV